MDLTEKLQSITGGKKVSHSNLGRMISGKNEDLSGPADTSDNNLANIRSRFPKLHMKIIHGTDPSTSDEVNHILTSTASIVMTMNDIYSIYDFYLVNCYAQNNNKKTKLLVDHKGCPVIRGLVKRQRHAILATGEKVAFIEFKVFRFPDSQKLTIHCEAQICFHKCLKIECGRKRTKKDVNYYSRLGADDVRSRSFGDIKIFHKPDTSYPVNNGPATILIGRDVVGDASSSQTNGSGTGDVVDGKIYYDTIEGELEDGPRGGGSKSKEPDTDGSKRPDNFIREDKVPDHDSKMADISVMSQMYFPFKDHTIRLSAGFGIPGKGAIMATNLTNDFDASSVLDPASPHYFKSMPSRTRNSEVDKGLGGKRVDTGAKDLPAHKSSGGTRDGIKSGDESYLQKFDPLLLPDNFDEETFNKVPPADPQAPDPTPDPNIVNHDDGLKSPKNLANRSSFEVDGPSSKERLSPYESRDDGARAKIVARKVNLNRPGLDFDVAVQNTPIPRIDQIFRSSVNKEATLNFDPDRDNVDIGDIETTTALVDDTNKNYDYYGSVSNLFDAPKRGYNYGHVVSPATAPVRAGHVSNPRPLSNQPESLSEEPSSTHSSDSDYALESTSTYPAELPHRIDQVLAVLTNNTSSSDPYYSLIKRVRDNFSPSQISTQVPIEIDLDSEQGRDILKTLRETFPNIDQIISNNTVPKRVSGGGQPAKFGDKTKLEQELEAATSNAFNRSFAPVRHPFRLPKFTLSPNRYRPTAKIPSLTFEESIHKSFETNLGSIPTPSYQKQNSNIIDSGADIPMRTVETNISLYLNTTNILRLKFSKTIVVDFGKAPPPNDGRMVTNHYVEKGSSKDMLANNDEMICIKKVSFLVTLGSIILAVICGIIFLVVFRLRQTTKSNECTKSSQDNDDQPSPRDSSIRSMTSSDAYSRSRDRSIPTPGSNYHPHHPYGSGHIGPTQHQNAVRGKYVERLKSPGPLSYEPEEQRYNHPYYARQVHGEMSINQNVEENQRRYHRNPNSK